jgi:hypothetical protein
VTPLVVAGVVRSPIRTTTTSVIAQVVPPGDRGANRRLSI